jgi:heme oxygenase (biliverdin-IX-beta and delta-forming)
MSVPDKIGGAPVGAIVGAMAELRSATAACHRRLERRLAINRRFSDPAPYKVHLERMLGFHAPLEQRLVGIRLQDALADLQARWKVPLLLADLTTLGESREQIDDLPRCPAIPAYGSIAAAFGSLYVFEGATLGGQTLLPFVERRLGMTAEAGARYLASYGADVSTMWSRFGVALESWCNDGTRRAVAVRAAVGTFEALEEWLCGAAPES